MEVRKEKGKGSRASPKAEFQANPTKLPTMNQMYFLCRRGNDHVCTYSTEYVRMHAALP